MTVAADLSATPARDPDRALRRPRWPYLAFVLLAAVFGWQLLLEGRVLLPTNPATVAPWFGDTSPEAAAVPSNGLMMDTLIFTWPARVYNAELLRRGEIPFWNPSVFAGYPHFALIQNSVLYPPSALFDLIEPVSGMGFSILLHLALAGALMFAFLRARGLADDAAFLGAAAFELNGMFLIRVSAPSYVFSGTWLPLLLLGAARLARHGRPRDGWPVLVATTASVLGGHPQITSLCLTLAGAFLLVETLAHGPRHGQSLLGRLWTTGAAFAVLVLLGVGVAGYQVVPFLELMANSARGTVPLAEYRNASIPVTGLLQALVPDVFGHPVEMDYWFQDRAELIDGIAPGARPWALNFSGENLYTGLVPPLLALLAVLRSPARRDVLLFAGAALFAVGVLLGSPCMDVAYLVIPGFRVSRPDRILFVSMAATSILTAYGFAALRAVDGASQRDGWRSLPRGAIAMLLLAAVVVAWPLVPRLVSASGRADLAAWLAHASTQWSKRSGLLVPEVAATLAMLATILLVARTAIARRLPARAALAIWTLLLLAPSLWFGWRFNPMQYRPVVGATKLERAVQSAAAGSDVRLARILPGLPQALPANVVQLLGVDDIHGASAAGVGAYLQLIDAAEPGSVAAHKYFRAFRGEQIAQGRLLDLLGAGLVLANVALPPPYVPIGGEDGLTLYRNPRALPRFFLASGIEPYATADEGRARLLAKDFDPATHVLLTADDAATLGGARGASARTESASATASASVQVLERGAHRIRLRVAATEPAVLVSSEVFYPGWRTRIDGAEVPTLLVDTAFRGAAVAPGTHEVEMVYVPTSFRLGLAVTVASLLLIAVLARIERRRARGMALGPQPVRV